MKKEEIIVLLKEQNVEFDPKANKEELIALIEENGIVPETVEQTVEEDDFLTIKVLQPIQFVEDARVYTEQPGTFKYQVGDIIENVNSKYKERLEAHPNHVRIMETN